MVQATSRTRKQRSEAAIAHALAGRWDEAAAENQALLDEHSDDLEAANRLGKALTELGERAGAIQAYRRALEIDTANPIARKNLAKLEATPAEAQKVRKAAPAGDAIRPDRLIDESGKSAVVGLHKPNGRALKRLDAGEPVQLEPGEHGVHVRSSTRAQLGHLDPRAGQRLRRLIEGGNRYEARIRTIGDSGVTITVHETFRHPSLLDEASFLPPSAAERKRSTPRAYTRASILQRDAPAALPTDDDSADEPDPWKATAQGNADDELGEAGFGEEDTDEDREAADEELEDDDDVDDDEDEEPPEGAAAFADDDDGDEDDDER